MLQKIKCWLGLHTWLVCADVYTNEESKRECWFCHKTTTRHAGKVHNKGARQ